MSVFWEAFVCFEIWRNQITVLTCEEIELYHVFIVLCLSLLIIWFYFNGSFFNFYLLFMFSIYKILCCLFWFLWACSILFGKEQRVLNNCLLKSINLMYGYGCVKMFADIILSMVHLFPLTVYSQIIKWGFL